jgi:hypothetical protein
MVLLELEPLLVMVVTVVLAVEVEAQEHLAQMVETVETDAS